mmetsp:Transcript_31819/g.47288  ORF Transcript_31819/g.47288 Transcript_31819/m.47288 type:complete len:231 (+) Transcript_31819:377-1069(+)
MLHDSHHIPRSTCDPKNLDPATFRGIHPSRINILGCHDSHLVANADLRNGPTSLTMNGWRNAMRKGDDDTINTIIHHTNVKVFWLVRKVMENVGDLLHLGNVVTILECAIFGIRKIQLARKTKLVIVYNMSLSYQGVNRHSWLDHHVWIVRAKHRLVVRIHHKHSHKSRVVVVTKLAIHGLGKVREEASGTCAPGWMGHAAGHLCGRGRSRVGRVVDVVGVGVGGHDGIK